MPLCIVYFVYYHYLCISKEWIVLILYIEIMKVSKFYSSDTNVSKFVFEWSNPKGIAESVLYRYGSYRERTVICCSIQSGCPVGCTFCGTGKFFCS